METRTCWREAVRFSIVVDRGLALRIFTMRGMPVCCDEAISIRLDCCGKRKRACRVLLLDFLVAFQDVFLGLGTVVHVKPRESKQDAEPLQQRDRLTKPDDGKTDYEDTFE